MPYTKRVELEVRERTDIWFGDGEETCQQDMPSHETHDQVSSRRCGESPFYQTAYHDGSCTSAAVPSFRIDDVSPQELGAEGERIAANYLKLRGWEVVERNWSCPYGEADIIAYDDLTCVFVEVKTRLVRSEREGVFPELAVDAAKQQRYRKMMEFYAESHDIADIRFDVVAIIIVGDHMARVHHLVGALEMDC